MVYLAVGDFKYGMDRRRPQAVGIPGTLWILKNAVLSRGGDIERCKKWVKTHDLPVNEVEPFNETRGLAVRNNQMTTFVWPPYEADFPYDVAVKALENPNGTSSSEVLVGAIARPFDNKLYAIAAFQDGNIFNYYDSERVADWETDIATDLVSKNSVAQRIADVLGADDAVEVSAQEDRVVIKAGEAGTPFTLSWVAAGGDTPEVRATGTLTIEAATSSPRRVDTLTVDGVDLIGGAVSTSSGVQSMAYAVANAINALTGTHGYTASAAPVGGNFRITITAAAGTGATPNGFVVARTTTNVTTSKTNMAGGVDGLSTGSIDQTAVQANVVAVAEVRASGEIEIVGGLPGGEISSLTIDGVELIDAPVLWQGSAGATANALVVAINDAGNSSYIASAVSGTVTLLAAEGAGATVNGHAVVALDTDITTVTSNVASGVDEVAAVKQIEYLTVLSVGTAGPWTTFDITLNDEHYFINALSAGMGNSIFTQKNRVWVTAGSTVRYCKLNDPMDWTDADASSGAGFINIGSTAEGARYLYGIEEYNGKAAIFAESTVIVYQLFADAQLIAFQQSLQNTGTLSVSAIKAYGADDVFYLDKTGIRSLRSRDGYDAAFASDIGSAVDPFVKDIVREVGRPALRKAQSVVETDDGRFMMAIGRYIITLSYFPASKITAWSYQDFGQDIDNMVRCGDRIVLRAGNELYTYGGEDGTTYPDAGEFIAVAETPFMSASDPATKKQVESYDHIATNEWKVELLPNPNDPSQALDVGRLIGATTNDLMAAINAYSTHFALRYTCDRAGFAGLSAIATHFQKGEKN